MLRYYITDRRSAPRPILEHIAEAIRQGVDYVQIREKDLSVNELWQLTRQAVALAQSTPTRILVNERTDVALAGRAHGVHLPTGAIAPAELRRITPEGFLIAVSCHDPQQLRQAEAEGADFAVYGPVFASPGKGPPVGLSALAAVRCLPVFALGGVTWDNAPLCMAAGAVGVAGIRLFQNQR